MTGSNGWNADIAHSFSILRNNNEQTRKICLPILSWCAWSPRGGWPFGRGEWESFVGGYKGELWMHADHGHISVVNKLRRPAEQMHLTREVMATRPAPVCAAASSSFQPRPTVTISATAGGMGGLSVLVFRNISRDSEGFAESKSGDQLRALRPRRRSLPSLVLWMLSIRLHGRCIRSSSCQRLLRDTDGAELCHRNRLITDNQDWPPVVDHKRARGRRSGSFISCPMVLCWSWRGNSASWESLRLPSFCSRMVSCSAARVKACSARLESGRERTLPRPAMRCWCWRASGQRRWNGLGINACQKTESQNAEPGAFALKCFPSVVSGGLCSPACCLLRDSVNTRPQAPASDKLTPEVLSQPNPARAPHAPARRRRRRPGRTGARPGRIFPLRAEERRLWKYRGNPGRARLKSVWANFSELKAVVALTTFGQETFSHVLHILGGQFSWHVRSERWGQTRPGESFRPKTTGALTFRIGLLLHWVHVNLWLYVYT